MSWDSHTIVCASCGASWDRVEDFLADASITLTGCQASLLSPDRSVFLFAHRRQDCNSTLEIPAGALKPYATNLDLTALSAGSSICNRSCFEPSDLGSCPVNCYMRWVRDLIPMLQHQTVGLRRVG